MSAGLDPLFRSVTADERRELWDRIFAPPTHSEVSDTWAQVLVIAQEAVDLFPPDTKTSLHRFGAETVLRMLRKAALRIEP